MKTMNIGICVISKNEDKFLDEWIIYHKNIGIDKIYFYDNNDKGNEKQKYVVSKYDFITYVDFRGRINRQKQWAYKHFFKTFYKECTHVIFLDVDEFLCIGEKNSLKPLLNKVEDYDVLYLKRQKYGDNDIMYDNSHIVLNEYLDNKYIENDVVKKCIINTRVEKLKWIDKYNRVVENSHYIPHGVENLKSYDFNFNDMYIQHFYTKSFTHFIEKLRDNYPEENIYCKGLINKIEYKLKDYFKLHPIDDMKLKIINKTFPELLFTKDFLLNKDEKIEKTNIDYVFPYVNSNDDEWLKLFKKYYSGEFGEDNGNGEVRYNDFGLLRYKLRSIEKNMPWINNIYMIVSSKSQIPSWLDTNKIKIVYHDEIIPNEFLPIFNSSAIEMFIHKIKGLSETFIYSNDDCYVTMKTNPKMFFRNNIPLLSLNERKLGGEQKSKILSDALCINSINLAQKDLKKKINLEKICFNPQHHDKPMLKSINNLIHEKYKQEIYNSITRFRSENNLAQRLYHYYNVFHGIYLPYKLETVFSLFRKDNFFKEKEKITNVIENENALISIDFDDVLENEEINVIKNILEKKYPNKSKYEL
jgi:hypothetical protein